MVELIYSDESYQIAGACFEGHRNLGHGFLEAVCAEALSLEFRERHIPLIKNKELDIEYKGIPLNKKYNADFVCYDKIIIELKACDALATEHASQVLNYLKATQFRLGILVNFGEPKLHYERIVS